MFRFSEPTDDSTLPEKTGLTSSLFLEDDGARKIFRRLFITELQEGLDHAKEERFGPDDKNIYLLNSYGFRSPEYSSKNKLLALGCSQTMGMGVPEEGTWPNLLAKSLGITYSKVAYGGWSIQTIVMNAFAYFKEFGHPEMLCLLLPDPNRIKLVGVSGVIDTKYSNALTRDMAYKDVEIYDSTLWKPDGFSYPKYIKRPYQLADILPIEQTVFYGFQMLGMLIQYCSTNNIKLAWGSWHIGTESIVNEIKSMGVNFDISSYVFGIDRLIRDYADYRKEPNCHLEEYAKAPETFIVGSDESGHMGVHSHMHVADRFRLKLLGAD